MGSPQTLIDFVTWAHENYPAQYYYLAIADHGRGTSGVAWDETSNQDRLTTAELRDALKSATNSGQWKINVLHYDTCLMAMLEDAYQVKEYADYFVASENLGWSVFAFDQYARYGQGALEGARTPFTFATVASRVTTATTPRDLAASIVDSYFDHPALQDYPRTISALDLSQAATARQALDVLASALRSALNDVKADVQGARTATQKFDSRDYYKITQDDEYVDLYHLAAQLKSKISNSAVQSTAQQVMDVVSADLVAMERHQSGAWGWGQPVYWDLDNAHGVSLYFPLRPGAQDYKDYIAHRLFAFTMESGWDEFLVDYLASGLPPESGGEVPPPGMLPPRTSVFLPFVIR